MILCAGRGERMRPLTDSTPKPLLPVVGKPMVQYHVENLVAAGITEIVINHAHLGDQIEQSLGDGSELSARIRYSIEPQALETGGGIVKALPWLAGSEGEPFVVVSGDLWTDYPLGDLQLPEGSDCHLVMVDNPDYHPTGDFVLDKASGQLQRPDGKQPALTYASLGVFHPRLFAGESAVKFPLSKLLWPAIDAGRVTGEYFSGHWFNVGTPEELTLVNQFVTSLQEEIDG